ncbi:MAG: PilW family protein [Steroidobacteraceae bacterium]
MSRLRDSRGLSMIELLVALAIGSFLIVGAVIVYSNSRNTFALSERIARLQEQGRYVFSVIEPDVELAGQYGYSNYPDALRLIQGANPGVVLAGATALRQYPIPPAAASPIAAPTLPASAHSCGTNFAIDVLMPVQGSDNNFALGPGAGAACAPNSGNAAPNTDTLTLRRAADAPAAAQAGRLQIYTSRLTSRTGQNLFLDGIAPGPIDADNEIRDLRVRAYYVDRSSVENPQLPALRVKSLTSIGGNVGFIDDEVMPGIEDLQVQFGIDTGDYDNDGNIDASADRNNDGIPETDGRATRYVDPDFPGLERLQVVSVRVWVRVRSADIEPGFVDTQTYRYGNVEYTPAGAEAGFRRVLMSRTITLRNSRTL